MAGIQITYPTIDYSAFLEYVIPHVPGVPEVIATRCIRDMVIDFCDETKTYIQTLDPTAVRSGDLEMELDIPSGTKLAGVIMLTLLDGTQFTPLDHYLVKHGIVEFIQPFGGDDSVTATVALKPSRTSTRCPSYIFEDHAETIGFGAQAMLLAMPNEEWGNPALAPSAYSMYRVGVNKAKRSGKTGKVMGNTRSLEIDLS